MHGNNEKGLLDTLKIDILMIKMNIRNEEFAEEVAKLLRTIIDLAEQKSKQQNVSVYDVELSLSEILRLHMTTRMIATRDCALRHFDNLKNRDLFIIDRETLKLNRLYANTEVDFVTNHVKMPNN